MFSLTILMVLMVIFIILAIKNWKTSIGAGPTILIVGAIVVSVYGAVKWGDYQQRLREYDVCSGRVERSVDTFAFNNTLVEIIAREIPGRQDIEEELRAVMVKPLSLALDCPKEPTFLTSFTEGL